MHRLVARVIRDQHREEGSYPDLISTAVSVLATAVFPEAQAWQRRQGLVRFVEPTSVSPQPHERQIPAKATRSDALGGHPQGPQDTVAVVSSPRCDEETTGPALPQPRLRDGLADGGGGYHPVVGRFVRVAFLPVSGDHERGVSGGSQRCPRTLGDQRINLDAHHPAPLPTRRHNSAVFHPLPVPISSTECPGRTSSASSISVTIEGLLHELDGDQPISPTGVCPSST
jgi:hypothetical protein